MSRSVAAAQHQRDHEHSGDGLEAFSNPRMFAGYGRQRGWEREISDNEPPDNEGGFVELSEEEVRQLELPKEWIA